MTPPLLFGGGGGTVAMDVAAGVALFCVAVRAGEGAVEVAGALVAVIEAVIEGTADGLTVGALVGRTVLVGRAVAVAGAGCAVAVSAAVAVGWAVGIAVEVREGAAATSVGCSIDKESVSMVRPLQPVANVKKIVPKMTQNNRFILLFLFQN